MNAMTSYIPATEQLVVEIFVRDARRSKAFYEELGFALAEDRDTFVVLTWEGHELYLDERPDLPTLVRSNTRVDAAWPRSACTWLRLGEPQSTPMAERVYAPAGFRDFGRFLEYIPPVREQREWNVGLDAGHLSAPLTPAAE
jgi:catechol 2,3-dioxygenase-like lactoylglutathione lyase family enzyme